MGPEDLIDLIVLTLLEMVLGIDNLLFISIIVQKVKRKKLARYIGLSLALMTRIILLIYIKSLLNLDLTIMSLPVKNMILELGGLFLAVRGCQEIYQDLLAPQKKKHNKTYNNFSYAILQIILMDLVFSLDSIFTAIALTQNITVIVIAFVIAIIVMLQLSSYGVTLLTNFPRLKILALVFIVCVGMLLMIDGLNIHISRNYLYSAFAFSVIIELLNMIRNKKLK